MEYAEVAESADALDSGSSESNFMRVQVPSSAPKRDKLVLGASLSLLLSLNRLKIELWH